MYKGSAIAAFHYADQVFRIIQAEYPDHGNLVLRAKGKGRGVGLYHTKQLIESLGGKISFESQVGAGTSFMVTFKKSQGAE